MKSTDLSKRRDRRERMWSCRCCGLLCRKNSTTPTLNLRDSIHDVHAFPIGLKAPNLVTRLAYPRVGVERYQTVVSCRLRLIDSFSPIPSVFANSLFLRATSSERLRKTETRLVFNSVLRIQLTAVINELNRNSDDPASTTDFEICDIASRQLGIIFDELPPPPKWSSNTPRDEIAKWIQSAKTRLQTTQPTK